MTLEKLNDDFGLEIHPDDLEGLTTDVYLELDDEFGKGKGPLVFNPEYAINLIDWLRKNSEPIHDMVEGFTDEHNVAQKAAIAEGLAKLVVWKLIPSKRLKRESKQSFFDILFDRYSIKPKHLFVDTFNKLLDSCNDYNEFVEEFENKFDKIANFNDSIYKDLKRNNDFNIMFNDIKGRLNEMTSTPLPAISNMVAGKILNDQNLDKEKERRKHPNSKKDDDKDLAELDNNGDGWLKYCRDKKKKESNVLTFEEIYSLR